MEKTVSTKDTINISCTTPGASIYYTLDDSEPSISSTLYEGSFSVLHDCTIKAIAIKTGMNNSDIASYNYDYFVAIMFEADVLGFGEDVVGYE